MTARAEQARNRRCNYCSNEASVWFSRQARIVSRGQIRALTVYYSACREHEGCPNWVGCRALYPDAELVRAEARS